MHTQQPFTMNLLQQNIEVNVVAQIFIEINKTEAKMNQKQAMIDKIMSLPDETWRFGLQRRDQIIDKIENDFDRFVERARKGGVCACGRYGFCHRLPIS